MSIKSVLIAGASGNLGPAILQELLASKFNVSVLTQLTSTTTFPPNVTVHKTDYSPASLESILSSSKPDAVVSTLNLAVPAIYDSQAALIDAAKASGVKRFIPSEFGSDTLNPEINQLVPIFGNKLKAGEHLKRLQSDDFTWTSLVTGAFFDWGIQHDFIALNLKEKKLYRWDDGTASFSASTLPFIAKAISSLLGDSKRLAETANRYIYIADHTVTNNEYIEAFLKATPGQNWTVEPIDSEETLKKALEGLKAGNFYAAYDLIKVAAFGKRRLGAFDDKLSNDLLGLKKGDLVTDIKAALAAVASN